MSATAPAPFSSPSDVPDVTGRLEATEAIETLRRAVVVENPLGAKSHHLVRFGQLVVLGHAIPARRAAAGARRTGATPLELVGVVETALFTAGMSAYELGMALLADLFAETPNRSSDNTQAQPARSRK